MKSKEVQKLYDQYVLPTYTRLPICLAKGKGSRVWDLEGREYLDFFPGWAVSGLGHCYPDVVQAIKNQIKSLLHVPNNFLIHKQALLAKEIAKASFPSKVFFCNSGAEATDGAIKVARRFGSESERFEIVTMEKSFHGRTFGGMAATGQERIREGFGPHLEGFKYARFNDLASVEKQLTPKTAAIFLEPLQGEGGVHVATREFVQGLRRICDERHLLLIFDEVQTGMGRTGKMFAFEHYGVQPDVLTLAKSLGGGLPIGAVIVHNKIAPVLTAGTHGSTFGGSPVATAAALAVFGAIQKKGLLTKTEELGRYLEKRLEGLRSKFSVIQEIRGLGLMRALVLNVPGAPFVEEALKRGLIVNCTQENVIRIFPAMTISQELMNKGLGILEDVFRESQAKV